LPENLQTAEEACV